MKWVSQGDSFSSVLELKKVQLFFKDMTAFFIFKTLMTKNAKILSVYYYLLSYMFLLLRSFLLIFWSLFFHLVLNTHTEHTLKTKIQFLLYCL